MKTNMRRVLTMTVLVVSWSWPGAAPAQTQEDDHASTSSGHDPAADARGALKMTEGENAAAGPDSVSGHTLGIGFGSTPGGITGLQLEYYLSSFMLNFHAGLSTFSPDNGDGATVFQFAGGAFWRLRSYDPVAFLIGARIGVAHASVPGSTYEPPVGKLPQTSSSGDSTQINIEAVAAVQLFFAGRVAVKGEVGPVLSIVDGVGLVGEDIAGEPKGAYLKLPNGNLLAWFSVLFYID